jgi:cholesterol transport system auxiliary component
MKRVLLGILAAAALAACGALPDKPVRQTMYDFGPASPAPASTATLSRGPLVLPEVETTGILDTSALLYRLAYQDANQLLPYAFAKWSAPPGQLLRQRLRDALGKDRPVLDAAAAAALTRRGGGVPPVLRVELEEFSQVFASASESRGVVRLRATLLESSGAGERLVAQRSFEVQRPAPSADAAGGVRALIAASDAAATDIAGWLQQR